MQEDIIKEFNKFIEKWCGSSYPHLIDSDENDGEEFRQLILSAISQAFEEGRRQGVEEIKFEIRKKLINTTSHEILVNGKREWAWTKIDVKKLFY